MIDTNIIFCNTEALKTELKWSPDHDQIFSSLTPKQGLLWCPCTALPSNQLAHHPSNIALSELNVTVRWKTESCNPHNALL